MKRLRDGKTFSALGNPTYRRFLSGQAVSLCGTWMQTVAQGWLVLQLTHSGTALGLVTALQFLPVLVLGPYGGLIADRLDRRHVLIGTQTWLGSLALLLGVLDVTGVVQLWMVYAVAVGFGLANCVDNPTRQSFVLEMVGPKDLANAVTLNSVMVNAARTVGPALAGVLIAVTGPGVCFLVNAGSYVAVIIALFSIDPAKLHPGPPLARARGQVRAGLSYVRHTPRLFVPLVMMAVIGTLAYEFQVVLPLLARNTFGGDASTYGWMTSAMGVGAVAGGLGVARRGRSSPKGLMLAAAGFGVVILLASVAPTLPLELLALVLVGMGSIAFISLGNATLQLGSDPKMRGRVMALWSVAFLGTTPVGGPIAGWVSQHAGPRWGLAMGGFASVAAAGYGLFMIARLARRADPAAAELAADDPADVAATPTPAPVPAPAGPQVGVTATQPTADRAATPPEHAAPPGAVGSDGTEAGGVADEAPVRREPVAR